MTDLPTMTDATATYCPADDKLRMAFSAKPDDETIARLRQAGYRWAPKQSVWVTTWTPEREDAAIAIAGTVEPERIDTAARAAERAERYSDHAANRRRDSDAARERADLIADSIPFGQPILVGHHSERRHRRDLARIDRAREAQIAHSRRAAYWEQRAQATLQHAARMDQPDVRARRVRKLEAESRRLDRHVARVRAYIADGADAAHLALDLVRSERWLAHLAERVAFERSVLEEQGGLHLLDRKPRKATAPLLNLDLPRVRVLICGQLDTIAVERMTRAEYRAKAHRGTLRGQGFRVRSAVTGGGLAAVFLTDARVHPAPAEAIPEAADA